MLGTVLNLQRKKQQELIQNPKIQAYIVKRSNEINRAFTVTKSNYVRRQQVLSQALVDQGKIDKALGYEQSNR